jgi:diadenosine tetraphosphate (Ap4A) HIT family hydrolase
MVIDTSPCELCRRSEVLFESSLAYVRYDNNSLSRGHALVIPKRHVPGFFDLTPDEQSALLELLNRAQLLIQKQFAPDGYNIGVNVGTAAGQSRMHVHVHLIPRYAGDVADPRGGIRCVLPGTAAGHSMTRSAIRG